MDTKIQFRIEDISHGIARFFDLYQDKLPVVVMVTHGFYGDIVEDTFDRGQMMIINAVSRQNRVVAKCELQGMSKLLSVPEDYCEKLCKIKNGRVSRETRLYNILRSDSLPLWVQFPPDRVLTVGSKSINTNNIPPLHLTKRFGEVYLLGNTLIDGKVCTDVIHVPLYLSKLRLSVVKGIKGQTIDRWRKYFEHLVYKCSSIEYDLHFGNPNIADYDQSTFHSNSKISYLEPKSYSSIISLVEGPHIKARPNLHVHPRRVNGKQDIKTGGQIQARPLPPLPEDGHKIDYLKEKGSGTFSKEEENMYITPKHFCKNTATPVMVVPKRSSPEPDDETREKIKTQGSVEKKASLPMPRVPVFHDSTLSKHKERPGLSSEMQRNSPMSPKYQKDIPRAILSPTVKNPEMNQTETPRGISSERTIGICENSHDRLTVKNVKSLSIDEVNEYLNILKLGHFGEKFRDNMIDGTLLVELTENMLREVFGMNRVEALRLLKFSKEGYIPV